MGHVCPTFRLFEISLSILILLSTQVPPGAAVRVLDVPRVPTNLKVAFFGDQYARKYQDKAEAVLDIVDREDVDMIVHLGDVGYENLAQDWCDWMNDHVHPSVPYFATPGEDRAEVDQWFARDGYMDCLKEHNGDRLMDEYCTCLHDTCVYQEGVMQACIYNGILVIYVAYDLSVEGGASAPWPYESSDYLEFVEDALTSYEHVPFKFCVYHFAKGDWTVSGSDVDGRPRLLDLCREHGAIPIGGNSHTYSRTHIMTDFGDHEFMYESTFDGDDLIELKKGQTISLVSGLGGAPSHKANAKAYNPWWNTYSDKDYGTLICTFNPDGEEDMAKCEFLDISSSRAVDTFYLLASDVAESRKSGSTDVTSPESSDATSHLPSPESSPPAKIITVARPNDEAAGVDAAGVDAAGVDAAGVDAAGVDAAVVDAALPPRDD